MTCVALTLGGTGAFAADANTQYDVVEVNAPDPGEEFFRFGERLSVAGDLTGDRVPDIFTTSTQDVAGQDQAGKVS